MRIMVKVIRYWLLKVRSETELHSVTDLKILIFILF